MAVKKEVTVLNERGMHLTSAAAIAKVAQGFSSTITLTKGDKAADAKSVLTLTTLLAPKGSKIIIKAEGKDARQAMTAIEKLFKDKFGEP